MIKLHMSEKTLSEDLEALDVEWFGEDVSNVFKCRNPLKNDVLLGRDFIFDVVIFDVDAFGSIVHGGGAGNEDGGGVVAVQDWLQQWYAELADE